MLTDFCDIYGIHYDICGKVIVATNEKELPRLQNLYERGIENGLEGLKMLCTEEIKEREPHVNGIQGIYVPQTGIIDYMSVSEKLAELIKEKGGEIFFEEKLLGIEENEDIIYSKLHNYTKNVIRGAFNIVRTNKQTYSCKLLITCCGLQSDRAAMLSNKKLNFKIIPFRGEYYTIKKEKRYLVKNLIYPVPDPAFPFLGVHYTRMVSGKVEAGPNAVFAFMREGYKKTDFDFGDTIESLTWKGFTSVMIKYWKIGLGEFYRSFYKPAFVKALQRLLPEIQENDLEEGGAGIRAQACSIDGGLVDDFLFEENERVLHVCNAPSPAATASLSIGDTIAEKGIPWL